MQGMPVLAAWLAAHLAVGFAGTWLAWRYALRRKLFDEPGARRSHAVATPRGGGISIVASMLVAIALVPVLADPGGALPFAGIAAGLLLVASVGWIDDHRALSPWWRLVVHAVAAALLAWAVSALGGGAAQAVAAFVAALVLVNVWNFMDGIDGLASSQAAIAALGYALFAGDGVVFWLGLALVAAICGFLPFNVPKARIFLGDVGSGSLGYALAVLASLCMPAFDGDPVRMAALALPLSVFLIDASLTLGCRILRREKWWEPHVQHAYQGLARRVGSHMPVTLAYGVATILPVLALLASRSFSAPVLLAIIGAVFVAGGAAWAGLRKRDPGFNP